MFKFVMWTVGNLLSHFMLENLQELLWWFMFWKLWLWERWVMSWRDERQWRRMFTVRERRNQ